MSIFRRKKEEYEEDYQDFEERAPSPKKFKDLKPENKKKRKEPPKPWGKVERLLIFIVFAITIFVSSFLYVSSSNFKLPGFPRFKLPSFSWGESVIVIEGNKGDSKKISEIKNSFNDLTKNLTGLYALYVIDLEKDVAYGVNEGEVMQAASLIKLPIMSLVYQKQEAGEIDINEKVAGSRFSYRELVEAMGKRSENSAQVTLVKEFGEEEIQDYIDKIGLARTSLKLNQTTARDVGLFFQKLWKRELVGQESRDELLGFLTDTIFEDYLVKGIPGVRVAHKYGREVHVISDAGIVIAEQPFVLIIMSDGIVDKEAEEIIPRIAKMVYEIEGTR